MGIELNNNELKQKKLNNPALDGLGVEVKDQANKTIESKLKEIETKKIDTHDLHEAHENESENYDDIILEIFPDLAEQELDEYKNEIKKAHMMLGPLMTADFIHNILSRIKLSRNKEITKSDDPKYYLHMSIKEGLIYETIEYLRNGDINDPNLLAKAFAALLYLEKNQQLLDKEQRLKLKARLKNMLAKYKEGKKLEVYEIDIDKNGNIVIKGKQGDKDVTIIFDMKTNKFKTVSGEKVDIKPKDIGGGFENILKQQQNLK